MKSLALASYRAAWEPALLLLRALAVVERFAGGRLLPVRLPARWRPRERLALPRFAAGSQGPRLWLHAASLGECKGLWAFARTLSALPCGFVLTANTVEARDFLAREAAATDDPARWTVALAPPDHPRVVRRFLRACDARGLVLFEMELWPHFILETRRAGLPVFWISARLTSRAAKRYGKFPAATRAMLSRLSWTQAQSAREADALKTRGCESVDVGADLRGLLYLDPARASSPVGPREGVAFVSFHADELGALEAMLRDLRGPVWVLPRKPGEFARFRRALAPLGFESLSANPAAERLLVDAFGLTGEILARAHRAVIGGSFADHGGHNLWEPLVAGVPMAIGPHHESQAWLAARLRNSGVLQVLGEGGHEGGEESGKGAGRSRDFFGESLREKGESARTALFRPSPAPEARAEAPALALEEAAERAREELRAAAKEAFEAIKQRVSWEPER